MKIKFHPMSERPLWSCDVIVQPIGNKPQVSSYSGIYRKFNVRDTDKHDEVKLLAANEDYYLGWIYLDELMWQMIGESNV